MGLLMGLWLSFAASAGPMVLRIGDTAAVEGADFSLRFVEVRSDSRCPKNAQCVWAGEATVVLEARPNEGAPSELVFKIPPGGSAETSFGDLEIRVVSLEPPTESGRKIETSEYVATVEVEKD
jgi:hypothetical protein